MNKNNLFTKIVCSYIIVIFIAVYFTPCIHGSNYKNNIGLNAKELVFTKNLFQNGHNKNIGVSKDYLNLYNNDINVLPMGNSLINNYFEINGKKSRFIQGEFIIKFRSNIHLQIRLTKEGIVQTDISSIDQLNKKYHITAFEHVFNNKFTNHQNLELEKIFKFFLDEEENIFDVLHDYMNDDCVEYAEPNYIYNTCIIPNDSFFDMQWSLHNMGQTGGYFDSDIDAPEAWDIEIGNENVRIAILDTGIDWDHPDLADNIWVNPGEDINGNGIIDPSDFDGMDSDGNGFIDDVRGWDFVNLERTDAILILDPNEDGTVEDNDPMDFHGHGTHCAGISTATANNGIGIAGVCWNCKIMPVRAGWKTSLFGSASFLTDDVVEGIVYATDMDVDVISMSFGGSSYSYVLKDAIDYAFEKGVMLIAAAGNSATDKKFYPAAYYNVIAVAATDDKDNKADFSNYGNWVDIAAPGVNIKSTVFDDTYVAWNGTSMASPHVAGLIALLLSKNHSLTADMIKTILFNTADKIDSPDYIGRGRINAFEAVQRDPVIALIHTFPDWTDIRGIINITGTAWGEKFRYYTIGCSKDYTNYSVWVELINSSSSVQDGILAALDTTYLSDGFHTIKLKVICDDGIYYEKKMIVVNNEKNIFIVDNDNSQGPWNGTPEHPFKYINDGIKNAGKDDCVFVYNGIYSEDIIIYASITLTGENVKTTILSGSGQNEAIYIEYNNVEITGFSIINFSCGIYLDFLSSFNTIYENNIINNGLGIFLSNSCRNNAISLNNISENLIGIDIEFFSEENNISDNIISNNTLGGITIMESPNNILHRNKITFNNIGGIFLLYSSNNNIYENIITNHKVLSNITLKLFNLNFNLTKSSGSGIFLGFSLNNNIHKNTLTNNSFGIDLLYSSNNNISCNNLIKNKRNARFISCDNTWDSNFWEKPRLFVKLIFGRMGNCGFFPWLNIDQHPALQPY